MIYKYVFYFFAMIIGCLSFSYAASSISKSNNKSNPTTITTELDIPKPQPEITSSTIQIALLLDTSGSMNGLIEQAKSQLWNILNELTKTTKDNQETDIQIALYEYGNPSKTTHKYQIHQLSPFTTDMDRISQNLFSLTTDGGQEYCGAVIKESIDELTWSNGDGLKMIYIAGNEAFTQGPVGYKTACNLANTKGIVINTIYCNDSQNNDITEWKLGAQEGDGEFFTINHNEVTEYVDTPFDEEIIKLNNRLNDTYYSINEAGQSKKLNQIKQDENASVYSRANTVKRAKFKASKKYKSDDWDLVSKYKKDKSIIQNAELKDERLTNLTPEQLEKEIEKIAQERETIQEEINELDKKRKEYKFKLKKDTNKKDLSNSIINTVKKQAKKKGYKFED